MRLARSSLFVDNLDGFAFGSQNAKQQIKEWVLQVRQTGEQLGVIYDDSEKRDDGAAYTKTLGADMDALSMGARPVARRRSEIVDMSLFLMSCRQPKLKHVEMTAGAWVHIAQYKRQLMSAFKHVSSHLRRGRSG